MEPGRSPSTFGCLRRSSATARLSRSSESFSSNIAASTSSKLQEVAEIYADDGVSGTIPLHERPEGRRLLEDTKAGKFDAVLVY